MRDLFPLFTYGEIVASNLKFIIDVCDSKGWEYLGKDDKYVYIKVDGFIFKPNRTNFPPLKLNPSKCENPTAYARYLLSLKFKDCNFSHFEYVSNSLKSEVICNSHGSYFVSYNQLMTNNGNGCMLCKNEMTSLRNSNNKINKDKWLERFNSIHGDRYDYSLVSDNIESLAMIDIICKQHGVFKQQVYVHCRGSGCKSCASDNNIGFSRSNYIDFCKDGSNLYFFELSNGIEKFIKIGISKDIDNRIGLIFKESGYKCLRSYYVFNSDSGKIYDLEKSLHREFIEYKYIPSVNFKGWSECFNVDFDFAVSYYNSKY